MFIINKIVRAPSNLDFAIKQRKTKQKNKKSKYKKIII